MRYLPQPGYRRVMVLAFYAVLGAAVLYLFFKFLWRPVLPFLLAFALAYMLQKPVSFLKKKSKAPRALFCVVLVLLITGLVLLLCYIITSSLFSGLRSLLSQLTDPESSLSSTIYAVGDRIRVFFDGLPFFSAGRQENLLSALFEQADSIAADALTALTQTLTAKLPSAVGALAAALPRVLLFFVVTVVASVYMTIDYRRIAAFCRRILPAATVDGMTDMRNRTVGTLLHYLSAYGQILLITFGELWVGFLLLGIKNCAAPALLIALFDILPVVGTGTVLLPWALFALIRGSIVQGIGLLVINIVVEIVRQIMEPRIVGRSIGQNPLVTLAAMYIGLSLFGIFGLILVPVTVNLLLGLLREGKLHLHREKEG